MTAEIAKDVARAFVDAFNHRDAQTLADTINFPHVRLANGRFLRLETREDFLAREARVGPALAAEGWSHTVMESIDVVHEGPDTVHLAIEHTRRHADETVYQRFETLWIVTLQNGHWGIQFRSSYLPTSIDHTTE
ncbi:hypothetical protein C2W62_32640 [Candidatus Entotheonella serta]|nr:hypothetical protein C2W62_32640 [Candidatus Entotheonella serta]